MRELVRKSLKRSETYVILIGLVFALIVQAVSGQFFSNTGLINLCRASMVYLVFGLVEMLSLICAGPDVSFPAAASLSAYVTVVTFNRFAYDGPVILVFLFAAGIGALCGALNGAIIARFQFPPMIVTLGTSSLFSGILFGPLHASNKQLCPAMTRFGKMQLISAVNSKTGLNAILPMSILIVVGLYLAMFLLLRYTIFGRGLYALGADIVSAERAGFKVRQIQFLTYCLGGALAGIGGMMYCCNVNACGPSDLIGGEMVIIAACILGGIRPGQGIGGLFHVIIGILLITMVENNLLLLGVPLYWQNAFTGVVILAGTIVSVNSLRKRGNALSV